MNWTIKLKVILIATLLLISISGIFGILQFAKYYDATIEPYAPDDLWVEINYDSIEIDYYILSSPIYYQLYWNELGDREPKKGWICEGDFLPLEPHSTRYNLSNCPIDIDEGQHNISMTVCLFQYHQNEQIFYDIFHTASQSGGCVIYYDLNVGFYSKNLTIYADGLSDNDSALLNANMIISLKILEHDDLL